MLCFFLNSTFIRSQIEKTAAPVIPPTTLAMPPRKKAFHPPSAYIFRMHSTVPVNFIFSPEVIIILLRTVSRGYESAPEAMAARQPRLNVTAMFSSYFLGRYGLRESQMPKQKPRQMTMQAQETAKPRYSPSIPSLRQVFLMQSISPPYSPLFPLLAWLANLVLAKSRGQTIICVMAPAIPPAIIPPRKPTLAACLCSISLRKRSRKEKFSACVRKKRSALVAFPLKKAASPFQTYSLRKQSSIPSQRTVMTPFSRRAC